MSRAIAIASRLSAALQPASTQCTRCVCDRGPANDLLPDPRPLLSLGPARLPTLLMTNHREVMWRRVVASVPQAYAHLQVRYVGHRENNNLHTIACASCVACAWSPPATTSVTRASRLLLVVQATAEGQTRGFAIGPDTASTSGAPDRGTDSGDPVGAQGTATPPAGGSASAAVCTQHLRIAVHGLC